MSAPRTVVVVTMPRSGSSLLAGVLHRLGVSMGNDADLAKGGHLNRYGCYEDQEFQHISLNILLDAGLLLDLEGRLDIDEGRLAEAVLRAGPALRKFVDRRAVGTWGFKDPGLAYPLPHLAHHLPDPVYVHLHRDDEAAGRSLYRTYRPSFWIPELRAKLPLLRVDNRLRLLPRALSLRIRRSRSYHDVAFFTRVIRSGHDRIETFLDGRTHLRVELTDLVGSPRQTIARLAEFTEVAPGPAEMDAAEAFVHPELLRSRARG